MKEIYVSNDPGQELLEPFLEITTALNKLIFPPTKVITLQGMDAKKMKMDSIELQGEWMTSLMFLVTELEPLKLKMRLTLTLTSLKVRW